MDVDHILIYAALIFCRWDTLKKSSFFFLLHGFLSPTSKDLQWIKNWSLSFVTRDLHSFIKSHHCLKGPSHIHLEGGISFGVGAFNVVCYIVYYCTLFNHSLFLKTLLCVYHRVYRFFCTCRRYPSFLLGYLKFWNLQAFLETRLDSQNHLNVLWGTNCESLICFFFSIFLF